MLSIVLGLEYSVVINRYGTSPQGVYYVVGETQKEASLQKNPIIIRNVKEYE